MDKIIEAMRKQGATDADIESYLLSQGAVEVKADRPKPRGYRTPEQIARLNKQDWARVFEGDSGASLQALSDAASFGLTGLLSDALSGGDFRENRELRALNKASLGKWEGRGLGVAGGLLNPVGTFLGPAKGGAGLLRTAGKGMVEGAAQGVTQTVGENVGREDFGVGDVVIPGLLSALFGGTAAGVARKFARRGIDPVTEAAERRAAEARAADAKYGVPIRDVPTGMPPELALDVAGPTTLAHARGAARSVEGRETFRQVFERREAAIPKALTGDVPDATVLEEQLRKAQSAEGRKLYTEAVEATKGQPVESEALEAFMASPAGRAAWAAAKDARANRLAAMGDVAAADRALPTRDVPIEVELTPPPSVGVRSAEGALRRNLEDVPNAELEAEWQRLAEELAGDEASIAHRQLPKWANYQELPPTEQLGKKGATDLPTGDDMFDPDELAKMRSADKFYNKRQVIRQAKERAMGRIRAELDARGGTRSTASATETVEVPDAEALHHMTRTLRRWAKGEPGQAPPQGIAAEDAITARELLGRVREELPEPFKIANRAWAEKAENIRMVQLGRRPAAANPPPTRSGAQVTVPLAAVERKVGAATPYQRGLFATGKTFDLASRIRSGQLTPAAAAKALADPNSPLARELRLTNVPLAVRLKIADEILSRQGDILSGRGEALEPESRALATKLAEAAAPTLWWTLIKGARHAVGRTAAKTKVKMGREDEAFARLLTGSSDDLMRAIRQLGERDTRVGTTAAKASARAGRVGGLLYNR